MIGRHTDEAPQRRDRARRWCGERGASDALGLALMAPAAIGLGLVILFLSRQVDSRATAQSAAEAAAQAAAQQRSPAEAVLAAERVGSAMLVDDLTCNAPRIDVDVSAFGSDITSVVRVEVTCRTSLDGLETINPPAPDAATYVAFATLDPFRGVTE